MTPDQARRAIHDAEELRTNLPADCWRALETVAGMREEWGASLPDGRPVGAGWGTYDTALEDMNAWRRDGYDARIVRRYVTEPEAADARWNLPSHRTEAGYPNCSTCDGGGCPDCTDPA